jgi:hypothetical protein
MTIVNNWYNNWGDKIPSFLRMRGTLYNESPGSDAYDSFGIFFDNNLMINRLKNPGSNDILTNDQVADQEESIQNRSDNNYHCTLIST